MAAGWAAALQGGLSIGSGLFQSGKAKDAFKKWGKKSKLENARNEREQLNELGGQEKEFRTALAETISGYARADKAISRGAQLSREAIMRGSEALGGQVRSSYAARGWSDSSAFTAAQRGVSGYLADAIGQNEMRVSGQRAAFEGARAGAVGEARGTLARFGAARAAIKSGLSKDRQAFLDSYYGAKIKGAGSTNYWQIAADALGSGQKYAASAGA